MPGAFTNYPNGVRSFGWPVTPGYGGPGFGGPGGANATLGVVPTSQVFFVNGANALAADSPGSNGQNPGRPFKTLNFALTQTLNNNNAVIYVGAQHVETVSTAGGLTFPTATAAGVTVVMLGNEVDRATVNFTATAAQVTIPASNVTWINPLFVNGIDALVQGVSVTGSDVKFYNTEWRDAVSISTLIQIGHTAAAKHFTLSGYRFYEGTTIGTQKTEAIRIIGGDHDLYENIHIVGNFSTGNFNNITTAFNTALFRGGQGNFVLVNTNASAPTMAVLTTSSGAVDDYILTSAAGTAPVTTGNALTFGANGLFGGTGVGTTTPASVQEFSISKSLTLPQTGTSTMFTVTGGPIEILQIVGLVTTVIGSVGNVTKLHISPTVGGSALDITTGVDLNAAAAGDLYILQTSYATAAALNTGGIQTIAQIAAEKLVYPLTMAPGAVQVITAGSDGGTGVIQWCMRYKPLAPGVIVS